MKPSALIFDLDGTLADTMPAHYNAWQKVAPAYGLVFPEDVFYSLGGWPTRDILVKLSTEQGITLDIDAVTREKEQAFLAMLNHVRRIECVADVALAHKGKLPMAVATGSRRHQAEPVLKQIGMLGFFDHVLCVEDCPTHKPDPGIFLLAASRMNVPPEQCLVYEDTNPGITAAKLAGMSYVDVRTLRTHELSPAALARLG